MKCSSKCLAKLLVVVGGLNWGLVGAAGLFAGDANWNVVNLLLGSWPVVENVVYLLVGLAALCLGHCCMVACKNGTCNK